MRQTHSQISLITRQWCLFGDVVNVAARFEANSKSNRITCPEETAQLLADQAPQIVLRKRGAISVKGKGDMMACWVERPAKSFAERVYSVRAQNDSLSNLEERVRNYTSSGNRSGSMGTTSWGNFGLGSGPAPKI